MTTLSNEFECVMQVLQPNRMYIFYFLRCLLAIGCSACEVYFYRGVLRELGTNVARLTLLLLVFSAGMFACSTSYLPSTTSMYLLLLSHGAWLNQVSLSHGTTIEVLGELQQLFISELCFSYFYNSDFNPHELAVCRGVGGSNSI